MVMEDKEEKRERSLLLKAIRRHNIVADAKEFQESSAASIGALDQIEEELIKLHSVKETRNMKYTELAKDKQASTAISKSVVNNMRNRAIVTEYLVKVSAELRRVKHRRDIAANQLHFAFGVALEEYCKLSKDRDRIVTIALGFLDDYIVELEALLDGVINPIYRDLATDHFSLNRLAEVAIASSQTGL